MNIIKKLLIAVAVAMVITAPATAAELDKIRFVESVPSIDARHGHIFNGVNSGIFESFGIDLEVIVTAGASKNILALESGTFDVVSAVFPVVVGLNGNRETPSVVGIFVRNDLTDLGVISMKSSEITSFDQLSNRSVAAGKSATSKKLFSIVDPNTDPHWNSMSFSARIPALLSGQVDAMTSRLSTTIFSIMNAGVPREDIRVLRYSDRIPELLGTTLFVSRDYLDNNRELLRRFLQAYTKSLQVSITDPTSAVSAAMAENPLLLKHDVETQRLQFAFNNYIITDNVRENGLSSVSTERLAWNVNSLSTLFESDFVHELNAYYDTSLLPNDRSIK